MKRILFLTLIFMLFASCGGKNETISDNDIPDIPTDDSDTASVDDTDSAPVDDADSTPEPSDDDVDTEPTDDTDSMPEPNDDDADSEPTDDADSTPEPNDDDVDTDPTDDADSQPEPNDNDADTDPTDDADSQPEPSDDDADSEPTDDADSTPEPNDADADTEPTDDADSTPELSDDDADSEPTDDADSTPEPSDDDADSEPTDDADNDSDDLPDDDSDADIVEDPCAKCGEMANSTGVCKQTASGEYYCECKTNYAWNSLICAPNAKRVDCGNLPQNANWNVYTTVYQTWNGSSWSPFAGGTYNEEPDPNECRFKCKNGYEWVNSQCKEKSFPYVDETSGLIWSYKNSARKWENALIFCDTLSYGGYDDWHLPTIDELKTLFLECSESMPGGSCAVSANCLESGCYSQETCESCLYAKKGVLSGKNDSEYNKLGEYLFLWSSSTLSDHPDYMWGANLGIASIYKGHKSENYSLHCVRPNCESGYFWNGESCEAAPTKTTECQGLPENAVWNSVSSITQTWNGYSWSPSTTIAYDENESSKFCRFKCKPDYEWTGSLCVKTPYYDSTTNLMWSKKSNRSMQNNTVESYCAELSEGGYDDWRLPTINELRTLIQNCPKTVTGGSCSVTDNCLSSTCMPTEDSCSCETIPINAPYDGKYSKFGETEITGFASASTLEENSKYRWVVSAGSVYSSSSSSYSLVRCVRSNCEQGYFWNGESCEISPTQTTECTELPEHATWNTTESTITQTWNGYSWFPSSTGSYNETANPDQCWFQCDSGYKSNGTSCIECPSDYEWNDGFCNKIPYEDSGNGLVWSAKSTSSLTWQSASSYCNNLHLNGYKWHLPTISELKTLIINNAATTAGGICEVKDSCLAASCLNSACHSDLSDTNEQHSILGDKDRLWSSSQLQDYSGAYWTVSFDSGDIAWSARLGDPYFVRCVSSSMKRIENCSGLPEHANWSYITSVEQTWNGEEWLPAATTGYTGSGANCSFKCDSDYLWYETQCIPAPYYDSESGLMWSEKPSETMTLEVAESYCAELSESGFSDWRMPTISELRTLIQNCSSTESGGSVGLTDDCLFLGCWAQDSCPINSYGEYGKLGDKSVLWSSSLVPENTNNAWCVIFSSAAISYRSTNDKIYVRCVRNAEQRTSTGQFPQKVKCSRQTFRKYCTLEGYSRVNR